MHDGPSLQTHQPAAIGADPAQPRLPAIRMQERPAETHQFASKLNQNNLALAHPSQQHSAFHPSSTMIPAADALAQPGTTSSFAALPAPVKPTVASIPAQGPSQLQHQPATSQLSAHTTTGQRALQLHGRVASPAIPQHHRQRRRTDAAVAAQLESVFTACSHPPWELRQQLADRFNMTNREIQVWFQNRRAKERRLMTEADPRNGTNSSVAAMNRLPTNRQIQSNFNRPNTMLAPTAPNMPILGRPRSFSAIERPSQSIFTAVTSANDSTNASSIVDARRLSSTSQMSVSSVSPNPQPAHLNAPQAPTPTLQQPNTQQTEFATTHGSTMRTSMSANDIHRLNTHRSSPQLQSLFANQPAAFSAKRRMTVDETLQHHAKRFAGTNDDASPRLQNQHVAHGTTNDAEMDQNRRRSMNSVSSSQHGPSDPQEHSQPNGQLPPASTLMSQWSPSNKNHWPVALAPIPESEIPEHIRMQLRRRSSIINHADPRHASQHEAPMAPAAALKALMPFVLGQPQFATIKHPVHGTPFVVQVFPIPVTAFGPGPSSTPLPAQEASPEMHLHQSQSKSHMPSLPPMSTEPKQRHVSSPLNANANANANAANTLATPVSTTTPRSTFPLLPSQQPASVPFSRSSTQPRPSHSESPTTPPSGHSIVMNGESNSAPATTESQNNKDIAVPVLPSFRHQHRHSIASISGILDKHESTFMPLVRGFNSNPDDQQKHVNTTSSATNQPDVMASMKFGPIIEPVASVASVGVDRMETGAAKINAIGSLSESIAVPSAASNRSMAPANGGDTRIAAEALLSFQ